MKTRVDGYKLIAAIGIATTSLALHGCNKSQELHDPPPELSDPRVRMGMSKELVDKGGAKNSAPVPPSK